MKIGLCRVAPLTVDIDTECSERRAGDAAESKLPEHPKVYWLNESPCHVSFFPDSDSSDDDSLLVLREGVGRFLVTSRQKAQSALILYLACLNLTVNVMHCSESKIL